MKKVLIIFLVLLSPIWAWCLTEVEANVLFDEANQAYQDGLLDLAIENYQKITVDYESAELFANLGNCFMKQGNIGKAILYYRKSQKLNPSDKDVAYNLDFAKEKTVDRIEIAGETGLGQWWQRNMAQLGVDRLAAFSILFSLITLLSFALYLMSRKISLRRMGFYMGVLFLFLAVVTLVSTFNARTNLLEMDRAIVMKGKLNVKSEPNDGSLDVFILHEGTEVLIEKQEDGWYYISLGDERTGWVSPSGISAF